MCVASLAKGSLIRPQFQGTHHLGRLGLFLLSMPLITGYPCKCQDFSAYRDWNECISRNINFCIFDAVKRLYNQKFIFFYQLPGGKWHSEGQDTDSAIGIKIRFIIPLFFIDSTKIKPKKCSFSECRHRPFCFRTVQTDWQ